jgi:O-acetyl-ADP-ribose deacetylase (regulator of RNase III)
MNWLKEILTDAKAVLLAPISSILCVAGVLLLLGSIIEYDKTQGLSLHGKVNWIISGLGFVLVILAVVIFLLTQRQTKAHAELDYKKGIEIKRGELSILIKAGEIQLLQNLTRNSAIVLPSNTTFVDDCATDKRSSLGAFFTDHFPAEIANLPALFTQVLDSAGIKPTANGQYAPGTTVILPAEFEKPAKIVITASTSRIPGTGITSDPYIICRCVEEILRVTADHRVDALHLPILGSGHGGIDRGLALLFLLLALLHFSKSYHHIRKINIIVHPKDVDGLNQSKELRQILAL